MTAVDDLFYPLLMKQTITYKSLKFRRRFGIELEISNSLSKKSVVKTIESCSNHKVYSFCYGKSNNNKNWHVKLDTSCGDSGDESGLEVASFVGRNPHDIIHMGDVATALKTAGATVNRDCGFHIHAEACDFSIHQVGVLLAYWIKCEPVIRNLIPKYRDLETCRPLSYILYQRLGPKCRSRSYSSALLYNVFLPYDDGEDLEPLDFRYRAINIINYYLASIDRRRKRKTIELRLPAGTLENEDIVGWTRLYLNFIEFVRTAPMPSHLYVEDVATTMSYLGLHHNENFYIFGPSLNRTRIWFLKKLIRGSPESYVRMEARKLLQEIEN